MDDCQGNILSNKSVHKIDSSKTEGLRVALLARVSDPGMLRKKRGKGAREEFRNELCDSIRLQINKMEAAAEKLGMVVVKIIGTEKHQHTTKQFVTDISDREDFKEVAPLIINHNIDALMVAYSDRQGRFSPVTRQILDFVRVHDTRLFELEHEHDLNNPNDVFILAIKAEMAEQKTNLDQNRAYETKLDLAMGGRYRGGRVLKPYMRNPDKNSPLDYITDPTLIKMFKKVRAMYQENDGRTNYTMERIADFTGLSPDCVREYLTNKTYHTGKRDIRFNKKRPALEYKEVNMVVETGGFEKIATEDEYNNIQRIINSRKTSNRKPISTPILLSRMVKCGHDGCWMSGDANKGNPRYRCFSDNKMGKKKGIPKRMGCSMSVPAAPLEEAVLREFEYICRDPEKLETAIGEAGERFNQIQDTKKILRGRKEENERQRKIYLSLAKNLPDDKSINDLAYILRGLTADDETIDDGLKRLDEEEIALPNVEELKNGLKSRIPEITKMLKIKNGLAGYSFEEKRRLFSYAFPPTCPSKRQYGVTVWKIKKGHYKFQVDCILSDSLIGSILKTDKGWEMDGGYSGKSNLVFS